ncbi:MAG: hypothetical protein Q7S78_01975 [Candidatus Azambacteria bacterium]|nr:hypothetical protein [Candidatus Azambacteria bacterium]
MISFKDLTEQKISEKYNGLSQGLKDALSSANTSVVIENIAAKYQLDKEKTEMLVQLVGLVILGFAGLEDMKKEMKETIEIDSKIIPLITDEIRQKIFAPLMNFLPKVPVPAVSKVEPPTVATDRYREPAAGSPGVVDLRNQPKPAPVPVKPSVVIPPRPIAPPVVSKIEPPAPILPKPIQRPPLIEAEPHKAPISIPVPAPLSRMPQVILRSPGLPPTDLPRDILDLRKDKGEF